MGKIYTYIVLYTCEFGRVLFLFFWFFLVRILDDIYSKEAGNGIYVPTLCRLNYSETYLRLAHFSFHLGSQQVFNIHVCVWARSE